MIHSYQDLATKHPDYNLGEMTGFRTVEYTPDLNYPMGIHSATFILRLEEHDDGRDYTAEVIECVSILMFEHEAVKKHYFDDVVKWLETEMSESLGQMAWDNGKEVTR